MRMHRNDEEGARPTTDGSVTCVIDVHAPSIAPPARFLAPRSSLPRPSTPMPSAGWTVSCFMPPPRSAEEVSKRPSSCVIGPVRVRRALQHEEDQVLTGFDELTTIQAEPRSYSLGEAVQAFGAPPNCQFYVAEHTHCWSPHQTCVYRGDRVLPQWPKVM